MIVPASANCCWRCFSLWSCCRKCTCFNYFIRNFLMISRSNNCERRTRTKQIAMKTVLATTLWTRQQRLWLYRPWRTEGSDTITFPTEKKKTPMLGSANSDIFSAWWHRNRHCTHFRGIRTSYGIEKGREWGKEAEKALWGGKKTQRKYKPSHCNVSCTSRRDCRMPDSSGGPELNSMPLVRRGWCDYRPLLGQR